MNLILVGSAAVTVGGLAVPYILFFVPPGTGGGSGGSPAKDANGNDLFAKAYLGTHPVGDHSLAQGLKGDATYLIVRRTEPLRTTVLMQCALTWDVLSHGLLPITNSCAHATDRNMLLMVMLYLDQLLFHLPLLTVMLLKTTIRSFSLLGPKMISVPEERDGGTKYTTVNE